MKRLTNEQQKQANKAIIHDIKNRCEELLKILDEFNYHWSKRHINNRLLEVNTHKQHVTIHDNSHNDSQEFKYDANSKICELSNDLTLPEIQNILAKAKKVIRTSLNKQCEIESRKTRKALKQCLTTRSTTVMNHDEQIEMVRKDIARRCEELLDIAKTGTSPEEYSYDPGGSGYTKVDHSTNGVYSTVSSEFEYTSYRNKPHTDQDTMNSMEGKLKQGTMPLHKIQQRLIWLLSKLQKTVRNEKKSAARSLQIALKNCHDYVDPTAINSFLLPPKRKMWYLVIKPLLVLIILILFFGFVTHLIGQINKPLDQNTTQKCSKLSMN